MSRDPGTIRYGRGRALVVLAIAFVAVSLSAAWTDRNTGSPSAANPAVARGLTLWRMHQCRTCHQIRGKGGFLGPDLTHRVDDETEDGAFRSLLAQGSASMPGFDLDADEQADLLALLRHWHRTSPPGPQPPPARAAPLPFEHFALLVQAWTRRSDQPLPDPVARGLRHWTDLRCGACHAVFTTGPHRALDLSLAARDRSASAFAAIVTGGRRNMPAYALDVSTQAELRAWLDWVCEHRAELVEINGVLTGRPAASWSWFPGWEAR